MYEMLGLNGLSGSWCDSYYPTKNFKQLGEGLLRTCISSKMFSKLLSS